MTNILLKNPLSPLYFVIIVGVSFILYVLHLTKTIEPPHPFTIIYVFVSIFLYLLGIIFASKMKINKIKTEKNIFIKRSKKFIVIVWFFYVVSIFIFIFEHYHFYKLYGSVPILNPAFEIIRFKFPINGYLHLIAMMNYIFLYVLIIDYFYYKDSHRRIYKYCLILFTFISIMLGALIGSRGILLNFLAIILIGKYVKKKISLFKLIIISILTLYLFGLAKFVRDYLFYGPSLISSIEEDWIMPNEFLYPLYFSYLGVAMNFNILNEYILNLKNHFWGYFSIILPFYSLLPGHQYSFKDLQYDVLDIDFHGTLTATIFSIPYIDFNIIGSLYMFFLGFLSTYLYRKIFVSFYRIRYILLYSYIHWMTILGIYTYMFDQFYVLFNIFFLTITSLFIEKRYKKVTKGG
jgi:oligosaccharide repeat unit polymerase